MKLDRLSVRREKGSKACLAIIVNEIILRIFLSYQIGVIPVLGTWELGITALGTWVFGISVLGIWVFGISVLL